MDDIIEAVEDVLEEAPIDWKAIYEQVLAENEKLRFRIVALRDSRVSDVAYYWDALLDWLDDPRHQVWLIIAMPVLLTVIRELFKLLQRRFNR